MIDYNKVLSPAIVGMKPSGIRKFFDIAQQLEGVISLGVGEPDFKTPYVVRREAINVLEKGRTSYTANAGLAELREEIAKYFHKRIGVDYDPKDEIIVTVGGSEGIDLCLRSVVTPGDEVLIVQPSFVCYSPIVTLCGGVPVPIETKAENEFRLTAAELRGKITDKTKLLVLPFPNNPTGAIMRKEDLEAIAEVLRDTNILVLSDEIYSELTYSGKHVSIASLPDMRERTIVINGFSKAYAMTGWRLGIAAAPRELISQMLKLHQYAIMSSPTVSQFAAITALRQCDDDIVKMRDEYDMRRRYLVDAFNKLGLDCFTPQGAFYVFPCIRSTGLSSSDFCEKLVYSKKVAVVPGNAFGDCGEGFVRVSYAYSLSHLREAIKRIGEFLEELKNGTVQ
ncbi:MULTISPECIES: aminotransferase class I/II-fold pyridoxal phosphate-dependent enzyme [Ruminococcus]|uniref:Aminotransferase n=1 Tax=Ruminococcus albus 8 TaxID=246199 RepID=E9SHI7_RUMAL|nr:MULTISPECIES: aminotransferase class I/II-fold pyridoxal phosphate-dependent enzyme [Ruminococcus]EGC01132.1 putative aspartate transaminase [Ruminococcus albus 8]MBO5559171.1 aminotransferase class I/II-fold pyridoxal phosphate-dependent enzyme [Ruminococcus sp.]MBQ9541123.1 aminotransferase class I/II-fold pyridoxal phosphate-dependent enzyme [Ruminococcus sp.]MCC3349637.1 aminotransferase class I/II-fold pyridoxal phosphate-dependent enzyme [Ruminococcus albus 8]